MALERCFRGKKMGFGNLYQSSITLSAPPQVSAASASLPAISTAQCHRWHLLPALLQNPHHAPSMSTPPLFLLIATSLPATLTSHFK